MIAFVDTETTSLDEGSGHLLEVALVLTDDDLNEVAAESALVWPGCWPRGSAPSCPGGIAPAVIEMHDKNGLWRDAAERGVDPADAEAHLGRFLDRAAPLAEVLRRTPLGGCTVGFDRRWLRRHMPDLESRFSYRSVDASTLTELARRWAPAVYEGRPRSTDAHRALPDARGAVELLRYYWRCGFVGGVGS